MYTLEELKKKSLKELKDIGWQLNVLPAGDRRCRQSWIDALVPPPLLQLLEDSPAAPVEPVSEAIEQAAEKSLDVDRVQEQPLESKFDRIVYPQPDQKSIAQAAKTSPGVEVDRTEEPIMETVETSHAENEQPQEWVDTEPPNREDYEFREEYDEALKEWRTATKEIDSSATKNSPGVEVDPVSEPIAQVAKASPGVESLPTKKAQEYKLLLCLKDGDNTLWYDGKDFVFEKWSAKTYCKRGVGAAKHQLRSHPEVKRVGNVLQVVKNSPRVEVESIEVQRQESLESEFGHSVYPTAAKLTSQNEEARPHLDRAETADIHNWRSPSTESDTDSSGARTGALGSQEGDRVLAVSGNHQTDRGQVLSDLPVELTNFTEADRLENEPRMSQSAIAQAAENSPGVDLDDELPECSNCFGDGYVEDEFGFVKFCQCETEPRLSHQRTQREIAPAAKISLNSKPDLNPILTGVCLSDRFLTRYSPPQSAIHYKADTYGQLNLFDFETESSDEPPDPDDFESLDAFREAIARWDWEHPDSFERCSDILPSSVHGEPSSVHCEPNPVHCEPPDPHDFDSMFAFWAAYDAWDEASDDGVDPLEISLDSFREWAPCPADWYEPAALFEPSLTLGLSSACKSSRTSGFFIPTFDAWCDRSYGSDEPPDTWFFARLPKPKPPKFPPQAAASWTQVEHKLDTTSQPKSAQFSPSQPKSIRHPETIPKLFHRIAAGSSTRPARSPPGGDAMS